MAIDDNASYELTGAQVKDLANKIKAKAADNIFVGATSAAPGSKGLVPQPQAGDNEKFLSGDGTWKTVSGGGTAVHKLTVDTGNYVWDPVICPVAFATQNIYVYDPDVQGPLDVIQLVQWALNGDDFVITGAYGMGSYEKAVPFKARVDVAVDYDFDPADPQLSEIEALQISFHVTDCVPHANPTEPRVPYEYDVVLSCTYFDRSVLEWRATVYQGGTLPLFYEAQLEEGASFTWESFANARVVQGVNTPSADIARALSEDSYPATDSTILRRILSALFVGKTISVKALFGASYFTLAGVEFDRFLLESTEGYYGFSDVSTAREAIVNERARLYLYASGNQGLTVQFFGENITVSGS